MHCDINEAPVDAVLEPLGHAKHVEIADAPVVGENVPTGQTVQDAEPMASLYLPAEHGTQVPLSPSGPVKPTLHLHALTMVLPKLAVVMLAGHFMQLDMSYSAPLPGEYLARGHWPFRAIHRGSAVARENESSILPCTVALQLMSHESVDG